jgi:predicted O-methyltransferase YrrM
LSLAFLLAFRSLLRSPFAFFPLQSTFGSGEIVGLFRKKLKQEYKVMLQAERAAGAQLPEYHRATQECAHPERWSMYDSMTAEVEVLEFLATLVTTVKPELIVETGAFLGVSAVWMARGLKRNGFGRIVSCEFDPMVFEKAKAKIAESGVAEWIELQNESSLTMEVTGTIDLFYSDSDLEIREQEVRRYLPQIRPTGLILMHDAASHPGVVREAALRLEAEGLISVVLLPTPRGLVVAQKRDGRK